MAKRVGKAGKAKRVVKTETPRNNGIISFNFSEYEKWTYSIKCGKFNNHFKNFEQASRHFYFILSELFPYVSSHTEEVFNGRQDHCHILRKENEKFARQVINKLYGNDRLDETIELWELGKPTQEIRVIGSFVDRTFYPLFIDHHHLIYPSKKYNDPDYEKYSYKAQDIPNEYN